MKIVVYLSAMKTIQKQILYFLEDETNDIDNLYILKEMLDKYKIVDDRYAFKSLLHLLTKITDNHHRGLNFFRKIEQILDFYKENIKNYYSNSEIFNIFKSSKRILLYLFDEKIITMDEYIIKQFLAEKYINAHYLQYFLPEIKSLQNEEWFSKYENKHIDITNLSDEIKKELPENFYDKRKSGENDNLILEMIRNDSIKEFIAYFTKNNYSLESAIYNESIYETNSFLLKNKLLTLIKYAVFWGSIQIFNYLRFNNVQLPQTLLLYAIHSQNAEIIHILEENEIKPQNLTKECLIESIKCHHYNIFEYIKSFCFENEDHLLIYHLKYYNFDFIENKFHNLYSFYYLCKYDYYLLVKALLKRGNFSLDQLTI